MYSQDAPFAVQIELVEGCTLSCEFCGINGIREKPGNYKAMPIELVTTVAQRLREAVDDDGWNPRIEFAMHGEPSMHPELTEAIAIFRDWLPKQSLMMLSNGSGLLKGDPTDRINALFAAGLNCLGLDAYEHVPLVPRIRAAYRGPVPVYDYPAQKEHSVHVNHARGTRKVVILQDIVKAAEGNHAALNTHCGGGMKPPDGLPVAKRCAKPFRELAIRWDGNVALCCNDFRGIYKVGNVADGTIDDLWQSEPFMAARRKLMVKDRSFGPCQWCNATSMRVGLLPDKMGQRPMDAPLPSDDLVIEQACAGDSYTPPVRRAWEADTAHFNVQPGVVYPLNLHKT